jgi:hypothetical protein
MGISLVAHIPYYLIAGRIEAVMQGNGKLDHSEARGKMTAGLGDHRDDCLPYLLGKQSELRS